MRPLREGFVGCPDKAVESAVCMANSFLPTVQTAVTKNRSLRLRKVLRLQSRLILRDVQKQEKTARQFERALLVDCDR